MESFINPADLQDFTYQPDMFPNNYADTPLQSSQNQPQAAEGEAFQYVNPADDIDDDDDDEEDDDEPPKKRKRGSSGAKGSKKASEGRRSIQIAYIDDKAKRHITFSKRKSGIMKKAYELSTLTGTQVMLLVVSETGLVYTYTTTKFEPMVANQEGKNMITACLNDQIKVERKSNTPTDARPTSPRRIAKRPPSRLTLNGGDAAVSPMHPHPVQAHPQPPLTPLVQGPVDHNLSNMPMPSQNPPAPPPHMNHYSTLVSMHRQQHPQQPSTQHTSSLHHDPQMLVTSFAPPPAAPLDPHLLPHGVSMHPYHHRNSLPNISTGADPNQPPPPPGMVYYQQPVPGHYPPPPGGQRNHSLTINASSQMVNGAGQGHSPVIYTSPPNGSIPLRSASSTESVTASHGSLGPSTMAPTPLSHPSLSATFSQHSVDTPQFSQQHNLNDTNGTLSTEHHV